MFRSPVAVRTRESVPVIAETPGFWGSPVFAELFDSDTVLAVVLGAGGAVTCVATGVSAFACPYSARESPWNGVQRDASSMSNVHDAFHATTHVLAQ